MKGMTSVCAVSKLYRRHAPWLRVLYSELRDPNRSTVLNRRRNRQAAAGAPPKIVAEEWAAENRCGTSRANLTEKPMRGGVVHKPAYQETAFWELRVDCLNVKSSEERMVYNG